MIPTRRDLALGLVLLAATAPAARAARPARAQQGYSRDAQRVLAQARAATGGSGWNYLRGWHETGAENGAPYQAWLDPLRYGLRVEARGPAGLDVHGFNGGGAWRIAPGQAPTGTGDPGPVAQARSETFFRICGFFYPGRFDAQGVHAGVRTLGRLSFDVLTVKPWGGVARDLWFDRRTRLLSRMVDRSGPRPIVTQLDDYRRVGPVHVAFHTATDGDALHDRHLQTLAFPPADRAMFSLPRA